MIIFIWLGRVRGRKGKRKNTWKKEKEEDDDYEEDRVW